MKNIFLFFFRLFVYTFIILYYTKKVYKNRPTNLSNPTVEKFKILESITVKPRKRGGWKEITNVETNNNLILNKIKNNVLSKQ